MDWTEAEVKRANETRRDRCFSSRRLLRFRCSAGGISILQKKGLTVLVLLLLGESITLANAIRLWSSFNEAAFSTRDEECFGGDGPNLLARWRQQSRGGRAEEQKQCTAPTTSEGRARSPAFAVLDAIRPIRRVANRKYLDCCLRECGASCTNALATRGGHQHARHSSGAEGAAAVSGVTSAAKYGIPLYIWKILFQVVLTTINVVCWLVPLRSRQMSENKFALSIANAFSGGVFLSLAFGHLIPSCSHGFEGYNEAVPYMIVLAGYLLIFFVEKVAFAEAHNEFLHADHAHSLPSEPTGPSATKKSHSHHNHDCESAGLSNGTPNADNKPNQVVSPENVGDTANHSARSSVILLGALAVHSILEMTALGLADSFGEAALLSLSIALHQPAESIALLVAFLKSGLPHKDIIRFLSVFSTMGPIGVAIGMAVNEFASPIVDAVMVAVVAGTFVYVGATEVIPEEFEEPESKWSKFAALMAGIISIFAITQYTMTLEG